MENDSLISKVKKLLGEIEVKETPKGVEFSLPFKSFRVKDFRSGKLYEFPEGYIGIVYNPKDGSLGYPFVEERYSHPCLPKFDAERQIIDLEPYFYEEKIKNLPAERKIVETFQTARWVLEANAAGCVYAWHHISSKAFEKYIIS